MKRVGFPAAQYKEDVMRIIPVIMPEGTHANCQIDSYLHLLPGDVIPIQGDNYIIESAIDGLYTLKEEMQCHRK